MKRRTVQAMSQSFDIIEKLKELERRVEVLERTLGRPQEKAGPGMSVQELLNLPDSLRRTMLAVNELKEATAEEVAGKSNRTRSVETIYLNQLVRMGYLTRTKKKRKVYFKPLRYY
ncbi:MAG: hypothetical protein QW057_00035 [Candidatus Bathyarchaeia archaeon]